MPDGARASAFGAPTRARVSTWARTPAASTAVFVGTFAAIIALIAVLLAFDLSLARVDRLASEANAAGEYDAGVTLLARGRASEAAERFGAAVAIDRGNVGYTLALARATLAAGDATGAETMLLALLDRAQNDGAVNLAMARTLLRERRDEEAASYFHRAIFGHWGADSVARRAAARFELIDVLARRGATQALLAELLPLQDTPDDSVALRKRLGLLFLRAGSPERGLAMLRDVLRREPRDANVYAGLGEAALALGNFRTARADLTEASRFAPGDARIADRLALADTVLALDPEARNIGVHARYVRSRALLARTVAAVAGCTGEAPTSARAAQFDSARTVLLAPARAVSDDAGGDRMIARATALWATRPASCPTRGLSDEALAIIHDRIRQ